MSYKHFVQHAVNDSSVAHFQSNMRVLRKLGEGAYAAVFAVRDNDTGCNYAVKTVQLGGLCGEDLLRTLRELQVMRFLQGVEYVTALRSAWIFGSVLHLAMDSYDCNLHYLVHERYPLTEAHWRWFTAQLLTAVANLHAARVLHRDIKPSNVLLREDCSLALCDFNLARPWRRVADAQDDAGDDDGCAAPRGRITPTLDALDSDVSGEIVTRWYRAPEALLGLPYGAPLDVWSVGCVLLEMALGSAPWKGKDAGQQLQLVLGGLQDQVPLGWVQSLPPAQRARVTSALAAAERLNTRPLRERIAHLPTGMQELLRQLLHLDPARRISAEMALQHPWIVDVLPFCPPPEHPMSDEYEAQLPRPAPVGATLDLLHAAVHAFNTDNRGEHGHDGLWTVGPSSA